MSSSHASPMQIDEQKSGGSSLAAASTSSSALSRPRARSPPAKKKMVIKPFKVAPKPPEAFADDTLNNLALAVEAVYAQKHSQFSQEELYRSVESLCNLGKGAEVYARLSSQCEAHIAGMLNKLAEQVQHDADEQAHMQLGSPHAAAATSSSLSSPTSGASSLSLPLLHSLQSIWDAHCQEMLIIRGIFLFLDRTYVMQQAQMAAHAPHNNSHNGDNGDGAAATAAGGKRPPPGSLWAMGLNFFCEHLQRHSQVAAKTISGLLTLVEKERLGESINRSLLKSLLRMLSALRLYAPIFQPRFLASTVSFYACASRKASESAEVSTGEYVHYIARVLTNEEERALSYLDEATRQPLTHTLEQELIAAHAEHLLGPTFTHLLDGKRVPELAILYSLFARIRQLPQMRSAFEEYVKQTAGRIVQTGSITPDDPKTTAVKAAAAAAAASSSSAAASSASVIPASVPAPSPSPSIPASTPATLVLDLLRLKATLDEVLSFSFSDDAEFIKALKVAFEQALNSVENTPAELIAKFIDRVLRTGGKGIKITPFAVAATSTAASIGGTVGMEDVSGGSLSLSALPASSAAAAASASSAAAAAGVGSEEVESLLEKVMFLFRYIHGKDVFQAFYKKDVAKRLLLSKSASLDSEKSMISKIKNECGASFTTKLEGMFKDMELSKDVQREFDEFRATEQQREAATSAAAAASSTSLGGASSAAGSDGVGGAEGAAAPELSVQVLTTGSWPAYDPVECSLPREVAKLHDEFKMFYLNKHSGRKLIWHHSLGTAVLRAHFPKGRRELAVSALQAVVLMLFNEHKRLTLEEIGKYAGITDVMEVKRTLASLALADEVQLLRKEPRNKKLLPTDVFSVNADFTNRLFRLKINSVQLRETKEEHAATSTRVLEDRQYALDACIVRVMKARKTMQHNLLMAEVLSQVKFPTRPPDVKKRIASLIEREYMERDKDDSNVYLYMA